MSSTTPDGTHVIGEWGAGSASPDAPPPFPLHVLPGPLHAYVMTVAEALHCPPDLVAVPLLPTLGSAIGTTRVLEVKPGHTERPCIWAAIVAPPSSKKSPALDLATEPAWAREQQNATGDACALTTDATIAALALLNERNPRGLLAVFDELAGWSQGMNPFGGDRARWAQVFSGKPLRINRAKSIDHTIHVPRPFTGIAGGIQPDLLATLDDGQQRGDGLILRFLFSYPEPLVYAITRGGIPEFIRQVYARVYDHLRELAWKGGKEGESRVLRFEAGAEEAWWAGCDELVRYVNRADTAPVLRQYAAKLEGQAARLALILQLARWACDEAGGDAIDEVSVRGAWELANYFLGHAARVFAVLYDAPLSANAAPALNREWVIVTLQRLFGSGKFTALDLQNKPLKSDDLDGGDTPVHLSMLGYKGASASGMRLANCDPVGGILYFPAALLNSVLAEEATRQRRPWRHSGRTLPGWLVELGLAEGVPGGKRATHTPRIGGEKTSAIAIPLVRLLSSENDQSGEYDGTCQRLGSPVPPVPRSLVVAATPHGVSISSRRAAEPRPEPGGTETPLHADQASDVRDGRRGASWV